MCVVKGEAEDVLENCGEDIESYLDFCQCINADELFDLAHSDISDASELLYDTRKVLAEIQALKGE